MVYMLTCACVDYYADVLAQLKPVQLEGVCLTALHGKMKQAAREKALAQFASEPAGGSALPAGSCSGCHAEWLSCAVICIKVDPADALEVLSAAPCPGCQPSETEAGSPQLACSWYQAL